MSPLVLAFPGNEPLAADLARAVGGEAGAIELRSFPDGESYVRVASSVADRDVVLVASLDRPDPKTVPLLFALDTSRELGARSVGLVAPYLCYMRQDRRFHDGEAIAARLFARLLSRSVDWLATVDPHLHRIHDLRDIFAVPVRVVRAAQAVAAWVQRNVERPLFVGPDEESVQWVADVAHRAGAPWIGLRKIRKGDLDIELVVPDLGPWRDHTPVLVDDIVSTGITLRETVGHLVRAGSRGPVCIAIHAVFADGAEEIIAASGARLVTCNTVRHPTNAIDVTADLGRAVAVLLEERGA